MRTDFLPDAPAVGIRPTGDVREDLVRLRNTGARMAERLAELSGRLAELEEKIRNHQSGRYG